MILVLHFINSINADLQHHYLVCWQDLFEGYDKHGMEEVEQWHPLVNQMVCVYQVCSPRYGHAAGPLRL
jgi:hypothetical protein